MRSAIILCVLCALVLAGCGTSAGDGSAQGNPPVPAASQEQAPDTASIVCEREGTRLLTPEVRARPDGVHFEISNRLGRNTGYAVETAQGGGMGDNAPKGEIRHTGDFPPGNVRIGCHLAPEDADPDYANLTILKGESDYKPVEIECPSGRSVSSSGGLYAPGVKGEKVNPVDLVRRKLSDQLEEGDVVEAAGYPESRGGRTVRVTRDGRVVAVFEFRRDKSGWFEDGYSACEGF